MQKSNICKGCMSQMGVPMYIGGPLSVPFKMLGLRRSRMNPNVCNLCETTFRRVKRVKQITLPLSVLCADVRGYTTMTETRDHAEVTGVLEAFYEVSGKAIWERDGIINKFIGDSVLALFNFPVSREDHVLQSVEAALDLQRRCQQIADPNHGDETHHFGVGVGVHTGPTAVGEIGDSCRDYTAIGQVVNLAARLQGAAAEGEVLVTEAVYSVVADKYPDAPARSLTLKGLEKPVVAYSLQA